jgi:iron complex outermembrane receptor protein
MQSNMRRPTRSALIGSSAMLLSMAVLGVCADSAWAADAGGSEVVVTGSRIVRRDFTSNSPIVTVNSQSFENTANVAIEATLNKLPQFTPAQDLTGLNSTDVQPTATNTVGVSTASLRGLGANRNLVLADGQRLQPVNGSGVVDLNTIPSSIIDHVEVITGGASAVYGADAISGVVNFILKKNFQGLDVDAQYGFNQQGDGQEFKVGMIMGANFADDRGNVTFGLERYTRAASYQKNHDFYVRGWADPTTGTNEFFNTGSYFFGPNSPPSQAAVNAVLGTNPGPVSPFSQISLNYNGTVGGNQTGNPQLNGVHNLTRPVDGSHIAYQDFVATNGAVVRGIKTNQVEKYFITSPLNRWSMYGSANYDLNENLQFYARGTFVTTHTATNLFSTPFINGWTTNIPYNPAIDDPNAPGFSAATAQHPVTAQLATLLNSRTFGSTCANTVAAGNSFPQPALPAGCAATGVPGPQGAAGTPWTVWLIPSTNDGPGRWVDPRSSVDDNTVWQFTAGLKGKAPISDWTWELYGSHGQAAVLNIGGGYASLQRFATIVSSKNYGANQDFYGNQGSPNNSFGVAHVHCTSGFYGAIFQGTRPSQDCLDAISAMTQTHTTEHQNIVEFNAQGTLFHLPAGDVKMSVGADYREEYVQFIPDVLGSVDSFIDQIAGVYPASYIDASTSAREGFAELLVPVLADIPGIQKFELELGARYSTYTGTDNLQHKHIEPPGGWTYKIQGNWQVTDWLRLRGGYNLAVRSPNIGELFLGKQELFSGGGATQYGDPCSLRSLAPFGAGGAVPEPAGAGVPGSTFGTVYPVKNTGGAAGAASAYNICRSLMGATGANFYYGGSGNQQLAGAPSPYGFVNQLGNDKLDAERAHTYTAGLVISSPFHDNPWLSSIRASVDWYDIKIKGAIQFEAVDQVKAACYGQSAPDAATAAAVAASAPCQLVTRIPGTGNEDASTVQFKNLSTIWTSGFDFQVDAGWNFNDVGLESVPGRLQLNWLFSYLKNYDSQAFPGGPIFHWAGSLGPSLNGVNPGSAYQYKMNTSLSYMTGPVFVSLAWRYLPKTKNAATPLLSDASLCNAVPTTINCFYDTKAYHVFDLSAQYTIMKNYTIRAGVQNLFDVDPPTNGATTGVGRKADGTYAAGGALASSGAGLTNPSLYNALGRQFYVGVKAKF